MRIPGLKTLRKHGRQWRSRFVKGGIILGYHRIADIADDPLNLSVSPTHFTEQMAYLRQHMQPLHLHELVELAFTGNLPPRAVAVTFDDGYADILHTALPILSHYQIPATLFVTTEVLGGEFWSDELARLVQSRPSPWWKMSMPHMKKCDLLDFFQWLHPLEAVDRQAKLRHLWHMIGGKKEGPPLVLNESELAQVASSKWCEVGSHTVTHPSLDRLTPEEQVFELSASREALQQLLGLQVRACSYPNGRFTLDTLRIAESAGYALACASHSDIVWSRSSRFCLPRVWARNKPIANFTDQWIVSP